MLSPTGNEFVRWEREAIERTLGPLNVAPVCEAVAYADVTWDLQHVRCPVTVLSGTDGILGLEGSYGKPALEELQKHVPHATVSPVPGAGGTYCLLEKPAESVQAFTAWVDEVRGAAPA
jgi:hypothetical protein